MNKKIFLVLILVLFASQISAFELSELQASQIEAREGTAVDFTARTTGAPSESFVFDWDFGDGVTDSTFLPSTSHSFHIAGLEKEFDFTVVVSLKENNEVIDSRELNIKVLRTSFKPQLIQPLPFSSEALERNREQQVRLVFLDSFRQQIPAVTVSISSAKLNDRIVLFEVDGDGFFSATVSPDELFDLIESLELTAKATGFEEQNFSLPVFVEPRELSAVNPFIEPVSFGSLIEGPEIEISFQDGSIPEKGVFSAVLIGEKAEISELSFSNAWSAGFDRTVVKEDLSGLRLAVFGESENGGLLQWTEFEVPLSESSSRFRVSLREPGSSEELSLGFGQNAVFSAEISSIEPENLENVRVWVEGSLGSFELGEDLTERVLMPSEQTEELEFFVLGSAELKGEKLFAFSRVSAVLSNAVDVNFLFPAQGLTDLNAEEKLKVALYYPNGAFFEKRSVNAELVVGEESYLIELVKGADPFYYAELPFELEEKDYVFELVLGGGLNGREKIETTVRKPMDLFLLLAAVLTTVLLLFAFYSLNSRNKGIKAEKRGAETRLEQINAELKAARTAYFKRKMTDTEYRDRVLKLTQEKQLLKKKL